MNDLVYNWSWGNVADKMRATPLAFLAGAACLAIVCLIVAYWADVRRLGMWRGLGDGIRQHRRRLILAAGLFVAFVVGADKGPLYSQKILQYVAAADGQLIDDSGVVGHYFAEQQTLYFERETSNILAAVALGMTNVNTRFDAIESTLTGTPRKVIYLSAALPRGDPQQWTNHNVLATVQKTDMTGDVFRAWVWFSEQPFQAPNLLMLASVANGSQVEMQNVTNTFPSTTSINGVPCVRYDALIPAGMVGVPLKPGYEILFGDPRLNHYLIVPHSGVLVYTNGVPVLPRTGWVRNWWAPWGTNLAIRFNGGVAEEAQWNGSNITGMVTL